MKQKERSSCETCAFYIYDDEYEAYLCDMNMDEDDYMRIMSDRYYQCPYYRNGDEYAVVRKQMQDQIFRNAETICGSSDAGEN